MLVFRTRNSSTRTGEKDYWYSHSTQGNSGTKKLSHFPRITQQGFKFKCLEPSPSSSLLTYLQTQLHVCPLTTCCLVAHPLHRSPLLTPRSQPEQSMPSSASSVFKFSVGQGQVQDRRCPQSHYLLLLGVLIILSLFHTVHFYVWHHCSVFLRFIFHLFFLSQFLSDTVMLFFFFFPASSGLPTYDPSCP